MFPIDDVSLHIYHEGCVFLYKFMYATAANTTTAAYTSAASAVLLITFFLNTVSKDMPKNMQLKLFMIIDSTI